jgi:hypothetical protein
MFNLETLCLTSPVPPETDAKIKNYSAAKRELMGDPFYETVSLLVPPDSELYNKHPYWGKFTEIKSYYIEDDI